MRKTLIFAAICSLATMSAAVDAKSRINQRQDFQQHRIARGINSGSLTAREAARLERNQAHIARYEARSRADGGGLNRTERARIETMQDRANHRIYRQKHDGQRR